MCKRYIDSCKKCGSSSAVIDKCNIKLAIGKCNDVRGAFRRTACEKCKTAASLRGSSAGSTKTTSRKGYNYDKAASNASVTAEQQPDETVNWDQEFTQGIILDADQEQQHEVTPLAASERAPHTVTKTQKVSKGKKTAEPDQLPMSQEPTAVEVEDARGESQAEQSNPQALVRTEIEHTSQETKVPNWLDNVPQSSIGDTATAHRRTRTSNQKRSKPGRGKRGR